MVARPTEAITGFDRPSAWPPTKYLIGGTSDLTQSYSSKANPALRLGSDAQLPRPLKKLPPRTVYVRPSRDGVIGSIDKFILLGAAIVFQQNR
jgi:hypothetical protein